MASLDIASAGNINYTCGDTATPASGAPGAYAQLVANAGVHNPWWACALIVGNLSAATPTIFNYQIARYEDGSGTDIANTLDILLEAATAALSKQVLLPFPVMVAALVGAAIRQTTASGQTLDTCLMFTAGLGT